MLRRNFLSLLSCLPFVPKTKPTNQTKTTSSITWRGSLMIDGIMVMYGHYAESSPEFKAFLDGHEYGNIECRHCREPGASRFKIPANMVGMVEFMLVGYGRTYRKTDEVTYVTYEVDAFQPPVSDAITVRVSFA